MSSARDKLHAEVAGLINEADNIKRRGLESYQDSNEELSLPTSKWSNDTKLGYVKDAQEYVNKIKDIMARINEYDRGGNFGDQYKGRMQEEKKSLKAIFKKAENLHNDKDKPKYIGSTPGVLGSIAYSAIKEIDEKYPGLVQKINKMLSVEVER